MHPPPLLRSAAVVAAALCIAPLAAQQRTTQLRRAWDGCTFIVTPEYVRAASGDVPHLGVRAYAMHPGHVLRAPLRSVQLDLWAMKGPDDDEPFGNDDDLRLTVTIDDSVRLAYDGRWGHTMHSPEIGDSLLESARFTIPLRDLRRMGGGSRVVTRSGRTRVTFRPRELAALRDLAMVVAKSPGAPRVPWGGMAPVDCDSYPAPEAQSGGTRGR